MAIFAGEVLSVERLPASPGGSNIATLRVSETWKGQVEAEVRVSAPLQDGFSCGFNFSQGQRVVVFASRPASDGSLIQGARAPVGSIFGVIGCDILAQPIQQRGVADELARLLR